MIQNQNIPYIPVQYEIYVDKRQDKIYKIKITLSQRQNIQFCVLCTQVYIAVSYEY